MTGEVKSTAVCLECESPLEIPSDCVIGEIIPCGECGGEMEVASTDPFTLEPAPEIEEDWGE